MLLRNGQGGSRIGNAAQQVLLTHDAEKAARLRKEDDVARFAGFADEIVCLATPAFFFAVGQGYRSFTQTSDDEVIALLDRARDGFSEAVASVSAADPPAAR